MLGKGREDIWPLSPLTFDGTIVDHKFPEIGPLKPHAVMGLLILKSLGHRIILWTCRSGEKLDEAVRFLKSKGVIFDAVNDNIPDTKVDMGLNSRKVVADVYIDDRSFPPFPGWESIVKLILV